MNLKGDLNNVMEIMEGFQSSFNCIDGIINKTSGRSFHSDMKSIG